MVAGQSRGMENFLKEAMVYEDKVKEFTEICLRSCLNYAEILEKSGVDVITILGSSTDLISPKMYKKYVVPNLSKLIEKIEVPTILHTCGDTKPILGDMVKTGANGVSIDSSVDLEDLKEEANGQAAVVGNLDVIDTLLYGSPQKVRMESERCIEKGVDVLASGCGIPPNTPSENLKAMVKTVEDLN